MKYFPFFLSASIWVFTVLCISASSTSASNPQDEADKDYFKGDLKTFFDSLSDISRSPNEVVKFVRENVEKCIAFFDKDKKEIQDAVTEGTEMEKKIQDILTTLKNFTIPLPEELQSELDKIGETAAAELTKLKRMSSVDDIENMKKKYEAHYNTLRTQIESLSKMVATAPPLTTTAPAKPLATVAKTINSHNNMAVSAPLEAALQTDSGKDKTEEDKIKEMEKSVFDLMKTAVPIFRSAEADEEAISSKHRNVFTTLSKIRNELIKVERIQFHLLRSHKDFKIDVAFPIRSSVAQFAVAMMFAVLF